MDENDLKCQNCIILIKLHYNYKNVVLIIKIFYLLIMDIKITKKSKYVYEFAKIILKFFYHNLFSKYIECNNITINEIILICLIDFSPILFFKILYNKRIILNLNIK